MFYLQIHFLVTSDSVRSYKMENITYITDKEGNEHAIIDRGNEEYTSMPKSVYDEQQAALSTPMVLDEAPSK